MILEASSDRLYNGSVIVRTADAWLVEVMGFALTHWGCRRWTIGWGTSMIPKILIMHGIC